jgi:hypothetical protein
MLSAGSGWLSTDIVRCCTNDGKETWLARDWDQTFSGWTGAEGTVEEDNAQRTLSRVRDAIGKSMALVEVDVLVYPKGSYPNRTNVVRDSDIDVAVELTSIRNHEFRHSAKDLTIRDLGLTPYSGPYNTGKFKDHVEAALRTEFGSKLVTRGNKALRVEATSNTLPADVVPCQRVLVHHSRTTSNRGIKINPDRGTPVINYPKQHLDEGLKKNDRTNKRYKRSVRNLKRLENEMVSKGVIQIVPSFLIESLVWNCRNATFDGSAWTGIIRAIIVEAYSDTKTEEDAKDLLEANNIKFLFHPAQKWTREQANQFLRDAWNYVGYS